jgi:hypothetical protein
MPYRMQRNKLKDLLGAEIEIGTVDAFQGREKDAVIFTAVATTEKSVSFVENIRRLNVAFTRRFVRIVIDYPQSEKYLEVYVDKELEVLVNKIRRSKEFDEEALKILDSVRDTIKKAVIELRKIDRLAFGTAHLLNTLHTFLAEAKLKLVTGALIESIKNDSNKILKHAIESALSITPLWDEDLRNKIENKLKGALGPS